jgi:NDP-sugar pyrophosphorylase family protein
LTDLDVSKVVAFHKEKNADATIVLTPVERPEQYGLVETDSDQKVIRFLEKPGADEVRDLGINTINAGIYVLKPTILDLIPKGANRSFEFDIVSRDHKKRIAVLRLHAQEGVLERHRHMRELS